MSNDFKISFSIDLNPYMAGLRTMLNMTQAAGQQIQPLLNLQVKAPEFGVFEKQIVDLEQELAQMAASQAGVAASVAKTGQEEQKATGSTDGLTDAEKRNKAATDMMSESFQRSFFAINTLQQVGSILKNTIGGLVSESNAQERAEMAYVHALQNRNLLTSSSISDARSFASELQSLTGIQDEQTIMTMAQLSAMGLQGDQLREAAKLAADLSVVMDTDLRTAARLMADAFNGNTGMLGRYIKGLDEADIKQRGTVSILEQLRTAVGGQAEAFGKTAPGQMAIYERSVDEVKESLGGLLTEALLPILAPLKGILDLFLEFPKPIQAVIGGAALLTTTLIALEAIGVRAAMKAMYEAASTVIPRYIASLSAVTATAYTAAEAMTVLQLSMFGLLGIAAIAVSFVGVDAYLKHNEEQMLRNAEAAKKAKKELDEYRASLEGFSKEDLTGQMKALQKEIFETGARSLALREELNALGPVSTNPQSDFYDKTLFDRKNKLVAEKAALDQANEARKSQLGLMQEEESRREKEAADEAKLLASKNLLIKAEAELEVAKKKLNNPSLNEEEIKTVNREIQVKEDTVKRLQNLGRIDREAQEKSIETRRRLEEDLGKFTLDMQTKQVLRQVELDEKSELQAVESAIRKNGTSEGYELEKIAITEKYAIKRIEIEAKAAVDSLEIEKKRLEALNTAEARYQIEMITKRQELIQTQATQDVKSVRTESNIKVEGLSTFEPLVGSIEAQQKVVEDKTKDFHRAQTEAARAAAREQLRIEQDKLDRMMKSNKELAEEDKRVQQERRREWLETHRVMALSIDSMVSGFKAGWAQMTATNRQAAGFWDGVWLAMKRTALDSIGDILAEYLRNLILRRVADRANAVASTALAVEQAAAQTTVLATTAATQSGIAITAATATAVAIAGIMAGIAASASAAATLVSIASWGSAAAVGEAAVLEALAVVKAASIIPIPGYREGGVIKKGERGFFEGESNEIIAPEHTFEQIARAELIPKLILASEDFNRKRAVETISTTINRSPDGAFESALRADDLQIFQDMKDEIRDMKKILKGKNFEPVYAGLIDGQKLVQKNFNKAQRDLIASRK